MAAAKEPHLPPCIACGGKGLNTGLPCPLCGWVPPEFVVPGRPCAGSAAELLGAADPAAPPVARETPAAFPAPPSAEPLFFLPLEAAQRQAYLELLNEYQAAGESFYLDWRHLAESDFGAYLRACREMADGLRQDSGGYPQEAWWLRRGASGLLGRLCLRPVLTPSLREEGGNIGYDIRPSARGQGWASLMLRLGLELARQRGLPRVLLTCFSHNPISRHIIRAHGGQLFSISPAPSNAQPIERYWINL